MIGVLYIYISPNLNVRIHFDPEILHDYTRFLDEMETFIQDLITYKNEIN